MGIEARYYDLTHGTHGFILLYVIIALFQLAGMRRGRATLDQYFFWPFSSLATMVVVGLSISVLLWLLSAIFGVKFGGIGENLFALIIAMNPDRRSMKFTIQVLIESPDALPLSVPIQALDRTCEHVEDLRNVNTTASQMAIQS